MRFAVQQLLGSTAAVDPFTSAPQRAEEEMPAGREAGALHTLRTIRRDRPATAEEWAKLATRSSWGSLPGVFKEPLPDRASADVQAQLKDFAEPGRVQRRPAHRT
jgi:hypothetical protein